MTALDALFDKKCDCPLCGNSFTSKKLRSRFIKLIRTDTDLCPVYSPTENNPLLYHILVCPACGYSFSDDFSSFFPPDTKEAIQEKVCSQWKPHSFSDKRSAEDAIKTYKLAVYCASLKKEKHIVQAGMYLKIAWLYRELENTEQEQRFMKLAIQEYEEAYMTQDYQGTQVSEIRVLYLLAELSYRAGNKKESGRYFSKVIEGQRRATETRIVEIAKERWQDIRQDING
ncbi:DUF2225 domain-containing protein [Bacillus tuaregi]|uniref:DUF2225 domain-containing protein n=1 Tax=Bacillus tuaregi TaxID=1816695 RepID=UPI0008F81168|nr:DUF2225 domain-containing protein [Bacillus tuaregi]